ncbi:MAG: AMP-binding protein [Mangrovibacterium sp.]
MTKEKKLTLPEAINASFAKFPARPSLGFVGEKSYTYQELQQQVERLAAQLQAGGYDKNNKIAIFSSSMPNWGVSFFSIAFTGAVIVPILPDFSKNEVTNILKHGEVDAIFVSEQLAAKVDREALPSLRVFAVESLQEITPEGKKEIANASAADYRAVEIEEEDLASIIYTSGTTGTSKGVMLSHKNIVWTAYQCMNFQPIDETDRFLSILPLSHTFENTLGMIYPLLHGSSVQYLSKAPSPQILLPALKEVKPTIMLSVPLVIEKIYKGQILKTIRSKAITKALYKFRPTRILLSRIAGKKLYETFGGKLKFFGVGGAKLDDETERFLIDAKFPLAIGYGLTETAPLLAGAVGKNVKFKSTGIALPGVDIRIANADPKTGEGEIQARGNNIMQGYYKAPELTKEAFTEDGWFRTGDLGKFNRNTLYIKGRIKNMILGATGENIYPEEIESLINRKDFVLESLVLQQKGRLVAMVHLNLEEIEAMYAQLKEDMNGKVDELLADIMQSINEEVSKFSRLQMVVLQPVPFEKTPTMKIKRFLYS